MTPTSPVVLRLGGSLLTLPELAERLRVVVQLFRPHNVLMIVGGGAAADEIRRLDENFGLTSSHAHAAAIAAMSSNAQLLSRVCGCLPVVSNRIQAKSAWRQHHAVLLDPRGFLAEEQANSSRLMPESWNVTSDSIATFAALHWPAAQIVFCKSCDPTSRHVHRLCQDGLLDDWCSNLLPESQQSGIELLWLNLRSERLQLQPIG